QDVTRFQAWKSCLSVLGIPFLDVVRVLAAVLLLGNIQFDQQEQRQKKELQAVANLLGVSSTTLYKGLTTVTYSGSSKSASGLQTVRSRRTTASSKAVRDSLAKALYIRTVATIIRRANSSKRIGSSCGTTSSESNESIHNTANHETGSNLHQGSHNNGGAPASSIGSACGKSYRTMAVLNSAVRYATMDGFIGILDMFGFEDGRLSRLEQLCINLCAETMQHFYNTHIFKASIESCRDEGVRPDIEIDFVDNVPCIDFISSLRTGLFSLLDGECRKSSSSGGSSPEALVEKIKAQHYGSPRYFEQQQLSRYFGIRHFVADVIYDTSHFLEANSDRLCDDIVAVFHKSHCSFGFVSHLFGGELRQLTQLSGSAQTTGNAKQGVLPRGLKFRIAPTASHSPATSHNHNGSSANQQLPTTLTADFHNRLDNLLRTLVHARPHFVRCIKLNDHDRPGLFERSSVARQVRALQILETSNNVNQTGENSRSSTDVNSALTQNQDFKAFETAKEHMQFSYLVVLNLYMQLYAKRTDLEENPTDFALIRQINEIVDIIKKHLIEYNSEQLEFMKLQDCVLSAQIRAEKDPEKRNNLLAAQVRLSKQIEHICTIYDNVEQKAVHTEKVLTNTASNH
ncbi:PREDICTED: myosin-IIIa-like, partial [Rhagoletis zephyria]|uniref:myosin-IIIa-like n=1 Tax=Rhagoletis zephyria TaxID=28612 RepID=UPI0008115730